MMNDSLRESRGAEEDRPSELERAIGDPASPHPVPLTSRFPERQQVSERVIDIHVRSLAFPTRVYQRRAGTMGHLLAEMLAIEFQTLDRYANLGNR